MPVSTVEYRVNPGATQDYEWEGPKDPVSTVWRQIDFAPVLEGRTLVDRSCVASGVTIKWSGVVGSMIVMLLQDGSDGVDGIVDARAFFNDGTDEVIAVRQPIKTVITLAGVNASEPEYAVNDGSILVHNGLPVLVGRTGTSEVITLLGSPLTIGGVPIAMIFS